MITVEYIVNKSDWRKKQRESRCCAQMRVDKWWDLAIKTKWHPLYSARCVPEWVHLFSWHLYSYFRDTKHHISQACESSGRKRERERWKKSTTNQLERHSILLPCGAVYFFTLFLWPSLHLLSMRSGLFYCTLLFAEHQVNSWLFNSLQTTLSQRDKYFDVARDVSWHLHVKMVNLLQDKRTWEYSFTYFAPFRENTNIKVTEHTHARNVCDWIKVNLMRSNGESVFFISLSLAATLWPVNEGHVNISTMLIAGETTFPLLLTHTHKSQG